MKKLSLQIGLLVGTWAIFALVVLWRAALAGSILFDATLSNMFGAALVHWRRLDDFLPWMVIGLLLLSEPQGIVVETLRRKRLGGILALLLGAGTLLTGAGVAANQFDMAGGEGLRIAGLIVMGVCAVYLSGSQVRTVTAAMRPAAARGARGAANGVTILDLWRFAAAQWALLMTAAMLYLGTVVSQDTQLGVDQVRRLVFAVSAAGALPSALMAAGIGWWDRIMLSADPAVRAAARPRVRAWTLALVFNCGAGLLLVLQSDWPILPGALLEAAAVIFYLIGFPKILWEKLGGMLLLAGWGLLALALGAFVIGRVMLANEPFGYTAAVRLMWLMAVPVACLGMGAVGMEILAPPKWFAGMRRVILAAAGLMILGTAAMVAVFLYSTSKSTLDQVELMRWLIVGALPAAVGVVAMGAILVRGLRFRR